MDEILSIAAEHGITVIEDAAQAHGARYRGKRLVGSPTWPASASTQARISGPTAMVGSSPAATRRCTTGWQSLANHGRFDKYVHHVEDEYRLDGMQAAILRSSSGTWTTGTHRDVAPQHGTTLD